MKHRQTSEFIFKFGEMSCSTSMDLAHIYRLIFFDNVV